MWLGKVLVTLISATCVVALIPPLSKIPQLSKTEPSLDLPHVPPLNLTNIARLPELPTTDSLTKLGVDATADALALEIELWVTLGVRSRALNDTLKSLALPTELQRTDWNLFTGFRTFAICTICKALAKTVITFRHAGFSVQTITSTIGTLCWLLNLQTQEVCKGVVDSNAPIILHVIDNRPEITAHDFCGVALQNQRCSTISDVFKWNVAFDQGPRKALTARKNGTTTKLVQITDIHFDPTYEPMGNADCAEPTCCRRAMSSENNRGRQAGFWGDYNNCDSPWEAVVDTLEHIKRTQKDISHVYFTGDIIDHGVWETSQSGNTESLIKVYTKIRDAFPNVKVYPTFGNHESHPLNLFAPSKITDAELTTQWLYKLMADTWIGFGWLPESTRMTILRGGFYTVSPTDGFRIIVLNNNVCYIYNWWVLYEPKDPDGQLKWFADTLLQAEKNGETVHVLNHIPPGDSSCQHVWGQEYRKIVNRFAHIITGQFNGHTHNDELRLYYDLENPSIIINVAWNGGSITPYANLNPNYKVYRLDSNTHHVEDYETWIYNLTRANEMPEKSPDWFMSYSFKSEYGLRDLSPDSMTEWIARLATNEEMFSNYYKNYVKKADPALKKGCDSICKKRLLCELVTTSTNDQIPC